MTLILATPIGLIINEAVTNSLKYAFPEPPYSSTHPGVIRISLQPAGEHRYQLLIQDDGVGLPAGFDLTRTHTLGLTMIQGLSRQIGGDLQIYQESGVAIRLDFSAIKKTEPFLPEPV